jgi:hypothetical protein
MKHSTKGTEQAILDRARQVLTEAPTAALEAEPSACCSSAKQEVCCDASEKSSCCGSTSGSRCGCQ